MVVVNSELDIVANRKARKWSRRENLGRALWALATPLFLLSPRPLWGWRRVLLRTFGAKVDKDVHVYPTVRIAIPWNIELGAGCAIGDYAILYALGKISIGQRATISQYAHICSGSHDLSKIDRPLTKLPVTIEADAWIAADAFVGPGVTVAKGAVVGARAVVMKDVGESQVVVGNPARLLKRL